ncbi:Cyclopropane-fatty-acyl-phospholipid synthase [Candidatus Filomicrobium marinum]|uniref:Cyclopropane-fatty-acyl-phospholipid synthase n=2 Tax=Filomicrobium TaxID=119044 RepID=A0A0D6JAQ0_9HYPH|nr:MULTISPECIES: cyclopropane-fatty-acyl-phospholipid synthase family protein [Filomicrobium]MCV0368547.1 cyclopropane-fatty-acyl-phospholipid synthase family protein [Filomicrobium sp.]CFX01849.1 Cyclopropane-fatty-acyl-phospholipid synthase [Candidatus Filomicrobium marinum]CPR15522.1 Cyclopropane-fatty-acyl-phospholipid synthase [Candidatus Filomicrobium marinum]SDO63361.1 cyclopropane-fatty-acyl-phospholipid synthase [Filomicrobium insigne]
MPSPMMKLFGYAVRHGALRFVDHTGHESVFGDGTGKQVTCRTTDLATEFKISADPTLAIGEAYMDGGLTVEQGTIYDLIILLMDNVREVEPTLWMRALERMRWMLRRAQQLNSIGGSSRNVRHHYDIDGRIYDLFLDSDRQYSCGYFTSDHVDLEEAQLAKKRHLAVKLAIEDGQKILDIGSGWGGLGLYLAKLADVSVTGITLSPEQLGYSQRRAMDEGLDGSVVFQLEDYRKLAGAFDRIVSVGMFEHVGVNHYSDYFAKIAELLSEDGVAVVHSIGRFDGPGIANPFIRRYIFPGGYIPALSEVLPSVERAGLFVSDVEVWRLHYAKTLRNWRERFVRNWQKAVDLKGEKFCRMWEFYLAGSEAAFRYQNLMVFQLQLVKRLDALPLTRDYMLDTERRLRSQKREHLSVVPAAE